MDRKSFCCNKRACDIELSQRKHTFFFGSRLNCAHILHMSYLWLNRCTQTQIVAQTGHSKPTVTAFMKHFRGLITATLDEVDQVIGGDGIVVEVDETKLGKRKYNRGHRVEGVWIVAGVERTAQKKIFLVEIQDRSAETLLEIIRAHVLPGSIVHTDMFRGYSRITTELGLVHKTVNHSVNFTDPETGVNTNTIEGNNNALKIMIKPRNRVKNIGDRLAEFIWRRKHRNRLWEAFLEALRDIHYDL
jgi:transposase-like protein